MTSSTRIMGSEILRVPWLSLQPIPLRYFLRVGLLNVPHELGYTCTVMSAVSSRLPERRASLLASH